MVILFRQTNENAEEKSELNIRAFVCMGCSLNRCCWRASFECNRIHFIDFCLARPVIATPAYCCRIKV